MPKAASASSPVGPGGPARRGTKTTRADTKLPFAERVAAIVAGLRKVDDADGDTTPEARNRE